MQKNEFLKKCQKAAQAPCGVKNIRSVPDDVIVKFNGISYYGIGYQMTFDKGGNVQHTAILHDLRADAVIYAGLDMVN